MKILDFDLKEVTSSSKQTFRRAKRRMMIWSVNGSGTTLITRRFIKKRTALFRRSKLQPSPGLATN